MCEYDTSTTVRQWLYTAPKFLCLMTSVLLFLLFIMLSTRDPLFNNEQTVILSIVFANFRQQPINNIVLATASECPPSYEKVTLGVWTDPLPSISSIEIDLWSNNAFCIKRTTTLRYITNKTECV